MRGQRDRYQKWDPSLASLLGQTLASPSPSVLNAIVAPPQGRVELANQRWHCYEEANSGIIGLLPRGEYGNASISRMDSCPQLHTAEWWLKCSKLWAGQDVTLVRGSERSLTAAQLLESPGSPTSVTEVIGPVQNAWDKYDELYDATIAKENEVVLLCIGLVARPLVHRLVGCGRHRAYDLGHLGIWFDKGLPKADVRA